MPKSEASKTRATLAAVRAVVVTWDRLMPGDFTGPTSRIPRRLDLADAVSRLRDELAK